jgi:cardiolipin synthase
VTTPRKPLRFFYNRIPTFSLFFLIQIALLVWMVVEFQNQFYLFYAVSLTLSVLVALWIITGDKNPTYKLAWVIPILLFPLFGGLMYLMVKQSRLRYGLRKRLPTLYDLANNSLKLVTAEPSPAQVLQQTAPETYRESTYLTRVAMAPVYGNTHTHYFATGEAFLPAFINALDQAKNYIFLEYFIIQEGVFWNQILSVLEQKVLHGVEVRVLYDDAGCLTRLPRNYPNLLKAKGIQCSVFNPMTPLFNPMLNHRNHRKIAVIDGLVGFTGGINLADEYINQIQIHGYWKDCAIQLSGLAVMSLTRMFLVLWNATNKLSWDCNPYLPLEGGKNQPLLTKPIDPTLGFVQPFDDSPLDNERVGAGIYQSLISRAQETLYITTPYLILDNEMINALILAAKSGVDVRILTPRIPDKKWVHWVTQSNYPILLQAGVRIFEYSPGFIHGKMIVADNQTAVIGTINMDYRSLYLHFECAVWLHGTKSVRDIHQDMIHTQASSQEITLSEYSTIPWTTRTLGKLLKIFAYLM